MLLNYHIGRLVLSSLCVGYLVRLGLSGARVAGWSTFLIFSNVVCGGWGLIGASACNTDTTQNQPHQISNTQRTENKTTDVVMQQHSRKLLMMDILMSETCWVHKKWNIIASDIKLVFYSSTITMMHGPINIRLKNYTLFTTSTTLPSHLHVFHIFKLTEKSSGPVTLRIRFLVLCVSQWRDHIVLYVPWNNGMIKDGSEDRNDSDATKDETSGAYIYTGCNKRNGPNFGRVFLMWNYIEKTQNTYIQSWTVWEIIASEVWNFDSCYTLTDYQINIETGRNMWFL